MVDELVEAVEAGIGGTVDVVPPVADEVLLIEDGAVGAQETVGVAVGLAHVEHLGKERHEEMKHRIILKNIFLLFIIPDLLLILLSLTTRVVSEKAMQTYRVS